MTLSGKERREEIGSVLTASWWWSEQTEDSLLHVNSSAELVADAQRWLCHLRHNHWTHTHTHTHTHRQRSKVTHTCRHCSGPIPPPIINKSFNQVIRASPSDCRSQSTSRSWMARSPAAVAPSPVQSQHITTMTSHTFLLPCLMRPRVKRLKCDYQIDRMYVCLSTCLSVYLAVFQSDCFLSPSHEEHYTLCVVSVYSVYYCV